MALHVYFLSEKIGHSLPSRLWKQGAPTVRAWPRSTAGRQTWFRNTHRWEETVFYFAASRETNQIQVCLCTFTPESGCKFKASNDSLPPHPSTPCLSELKVLFFCSFFFYCVSTHCFHAPKTTYKFSVIFITTLRNG